MEAYRLRIWNNYTASDRKLRSQARKIHDWFSVVWDKRSQGDVLLLDGRSQARMDPRPWPRDNPIHMQTDHFAGRRGNFAILVMLMLDLQFFHTLQCHCSAPQFNWK